MNSKIIKIDKNSELPLFGVDFIGIIDRGTNIIEIKPLTLCNLKCKYCFVSSGNYDTDFIVDSNYLVEKVREVITIKGSFDIEIHIAPYGEILLYKEIFDLIRALWKLPGVNIISMQSNGLLLNDEIVNKLNEVGLSRINISLNTLNKEKANYLCNTSNYDMEKLLKNIQALLKTNIEILLAPVWFPGENDSDIEEIIKLILSYRNQGYSEKKIQIGIQKYLIYRTGRKLKKIKPKTWNYFYKQLSILEKKYKLKLKLGPHDFGIHKRNLFSKMKFNKGDLLKVTIVSKGRWKNEYIGRFSENYGIKVLYKKPIIAPDEIIRKELTVRIIKANYRDNIITALFPI